MEAYEQQLKEQVDLIRRLTDDVNMLRQGKGLVGDERSEDGGIRVEITGEEDPLPPPRGEGSKKKYEERKKKRKRDFSDDDGDDAGEAALKQVFKKAKLNEFDGIRKTGEDLEAWIEELEDFFVLREFSEEAKAKIAILQLRSVAKLWWKSYMQTRTNESTIAWKEFRAEAEKRYCSPHYNMEKKMEFYGFKQKEADKHDLSVDEYKERFLCVFTNMLEK